MQEIPLQVGKDAMMHDTHELARSLVTGKLDLLCPLMELRTCPSYRETALSGSGVIRANNDGVLSFRLSGTPSDPFPQVLLGGKPQGFLYDIEDHVMLIARDQKGREWRSDPLLIHMTHPGELIHGYVSRKVGSLIHAQTTPLPGENTVRIFIPNQPQLPFDQATQHERRAGNEILEDGWAIDHHTRTIGDAKVTFRRHDSEWLSIEATQPTALSLDWVGLMCHALAFVSARFVQPAAVERSSGEDEYVELYSGPFRQYRSSMPRPITELTPEHAPSFWSLVERFFIFTQEMGGLQADFLSELEAVRAGALMSIQSACLTLAIGIESICTNFLPGVHPATWNPAARSSLEQHIAAWDGDSATRQRVLAWLRSKGEPRTVDRLHAWAKTQGVKKELVESWAKLRNRRAHGKAVSQTQPSYDQYYSVVELFYRLVTSIIGYDGKILETSIPGWGRETT